MCKQAHDTVEKIHQFDYNQSKDLEELSNDVSKMQNYIDRIQSHTKSGKIQLESYTIGTVKKYRIDDLLLENTCSREDTDTKEELQKKLANTSNIEEFLKLAKELGDENLTDEQKRILTLWETAEGIKNGAYKVGKEFVKGLFDFVLHPVKTIESTIDALAHPIETFDYLSMAIRDSYERDVINGDAKSRAEWFSYALGTINQTTRSGNKRAGRRIKDRNGNNKSRYQSRRQQSKRGNRKNLQSKLIAICA